MTENIVADEKKYDSEIKVNERMMEGVSINTLRYNPDLCINCEICIDVCPHAVFEPGERRVVLVRAELCMECGACMVNCPVNAITVDSGVGCAAAMIVSALKGDRGSSCSSSEGNAESCGG